MPNGQPGDSRRGAFDQNGAFLFDNVPPGAYKLYAFDGVPDGVWDDSDLVKQISNLGADISLAEEETKAVDVRLLLKSDLVPTLKKLGLE